MPARAQSLPHWETGTISRVGEAPEITGADGSVVRFAYRTLWKARRHPVHVHVGDKVLFTRGVRDSGRASQVVLTSLAPSGHYPETAPHGRIYLSPQRTPEQRSPVPRATQGTASRQRAHVRVLERLFVADIIGDDTASAGGDSPVGSSSAGGLSSDALEVSPVLRAGLSTAGEIPLIWRHDPYAPAGCPAWAQCEHGTPHPLAAS
eukprot:TRINITY_DN23477_c0_g1_i1.p2 TRINITY_DN23477_c0_g1~~TRINITY_DN23477_c0_g1_i1.p2  ORF type:complete len:206 (+),score=29.87 TRINITY_DN23477_c0_g1_i1:79-696(+)